MTDYSFWNESDFWIGDIPLNYIDENGCMWMIQDVDGWWELPPPEIPDDTRPYSDDGDYYVSGRYAARTVTIKGRIIPPVTASRQVVTDARDRLSSTLNSVRKTLVFKVMEPRYPKQANVQINSVPTMVINDYNNHVEFTIQFKASDPRKYSAEMHNISAQLAGKSEWGRRYPRQFYYTYGDVPSDGTIYANNNGDYHTYGVIRISGPVTNPSLLHVESNSTLKFNIVLGTTDYLDVNLRARTVRLNGKQFKRSSLTTDSTWFTLGPGENSIRFRGTQHIPAKESKEAATNQALNPSFDYSTRPDNLSVYGASLTPFQTTVRKVARSSIDTTDNSGYVAGMKAKTSSPNTNMTFGVPSSSITPVTGETYDQAILNRIVDIGSQGLMPNTTYTAMVEVVIPDTFMGEYSEVETINYAFNSTPDKFFESYWSAFGFASSSSLTAQETESSPENGYARVQVMDDVTKIASSGIRYKQDKGDIPIATLAQLSMVVRTNRVVPIQPVVRWYNGSSLVRESYGVSVTPESAGQWVTLSVDATTPQVFTRFEFSVELTQAEEGATWSVFDYLDARSLMVQLGEGATAEFFDGYVSDTKTETYTWSGDTGKSTSKRVEKVNGEMSLHEYSRSLVFFSLSGDNESISGIDLDTVVLDTAPNEPGEYQLKIVFTTGEDFFTNAFVSLWNGSPSPSDELFFDRFAIIEGNYEGDYFDGTYTGARWAGTAHISQSIQSQVVGVPEAEALIQYRSAWIR